MGMFSKITGGIGDIATAAIGAKTAYDLLFDEEDVPSDVRGAGRDVRAIAKALQDPDDPMFKKLVEQESGIISRDYAKALREVGLENQRQMARTGGMGILDPERRDEALAGAYSKSFADRKALARRQAREYLSGALTANSAVAGAYAPMLSANQRDREREASGMQMLLDLSQKIGQPSNMGINFNFNDLTNPRGLSFGGSGFGAASVMPTTYTTPGSI